MKNMIILMNAMKHYSHDELIREGSDVRELLAREMSVPAFHKVTDKVRQKYFLNRV